MQEHAIAAAAMESDERRALDGSTLAPDSPSPSTATASRAVGTGRLIIVSNRVMLPGATQAGGLAQALLAALRQRGGCWMGWSGGISTQLEPRRHDEAGIRYVTWDLSQRAFDAFYRDYANRTLWPLLHGRTDLMVFRRAALQGYLAVNERFADLIMREATEHDTLWVHDYHLIPLASMLRARGLRCRIGFFLHTPLPAAHTLVTLPQHRSILGLLAAYDLVGVQTEADAQALRNYLCAELDASDDDGQLHVPHAGDLQVRAFPIGIDVDALTRLAEASESLLETRELRASLGRSDLLIGADRLDYSKGLPQRLRAFGHLLANYPELEGRATYLQITPDSRREVREYRQLSREVQRLVGDINGHHAGAAWTPVRYVNRGFPHAVLSGYYRVARVGVVTPLRDGMNLVAKEFIACQPEADPGVLVLSEFAGAAQDLADCALIVNPHDIEGCARTLAQALSMPLPERQRRWSDAMALLRRGDIHGWTGDFLDALRAIPEDRDLGSVEAPAARATAVAAHRRRSRA